MVIASTYYRITNKIQTNKQIITVRGVFYDDDQASLEDFKVKSHATMDDAIKYCFIKARKFLEDQLPDAETLENEGDVKDMKANIELIDKEAHKMCAGDANEGFIISYRGINCEFQATVKEVYVS